MWRRLKDKLEAGNKHLQTTYLTKDKFLEYIKNLQKNPIREWAKKKDDTQMAGTHM